MCCIYKDKHLFLSRVQILEKCFFTKVGERHGAAAASPLNPQSAVFADIGTYNYVFWPERCDYAGSAFCRMSCHHQNAGFAVMISVGEKCYLGAVSVCYFFALINNGRVAAVCGQKRRRVRQRMSAPARSKYFDGSRTSHNDVGAA